MRTEHPVSEQDHERSDSSPRQDPHREGPAASEVAPYLSILIPAFNAARGLAGNLARLAGYLRSLPCPGEIIVVDDGSTDDTWAVAMRFAETTPDLQVQVIRAPRNEGKGAAVQRGLKAVRGRYAVFLDADLEYAPDQIDLILRALQAGADVAIANRELPTSRVLLHRRDLLQQFLRYASGRILNLLVRMAVLPGLRDTQAGLKGLRMEACRPMVDQLSCRGFGIDIELLLLSRAHRLTIREVPVRVDSRPASSTVRMATDALGLLRDVCMILFRHGLRWTADRTQWDVLRPAAGPLVDTRTAAVFGILLGTLGAGAAASAHMKGIGRDAVLGWLIAWLGVVVLGRAIDGGWHGIRPPRFSGSSERLIFFALLCLVAGLRLWRLDSLPSTMHGDSAECGILGQSLLRGDAGDVFDFSPWYYTPFLSFLPYAASFATFDLSVFALRFPSSCMGILAAVPFYFMTRAWFGVRVAQISLALFAVSHPLIHFSRIGLWNIQVILFQLCAFALLVGAVSRRSALLAVLAGLATGYGLYSYTAARLIPLLCLLLAVHPLLRRVSPLEWTRRIGLPYFGALFIAVLPLLVSYVKTPAAWNTDRAGAVSVLAEENRFHVEGMYGENASAFDILLGQTWRTVKGIAIAGDASPQYGNREQPMLSPVSVLLLIVGLAACFRHVHRLGSFFVPLWFLASLLLGSILVIDPPSYTRLIGLFPANCILIAFGAERIWVALLNRRIVSRKAGLALAGLFLAYSGWFNLRSYYLYAQSVKSSTGEWDIVKVLEGEGPNVDYFLFTGPFLYADASVFRLWVADARTVSAFTENDIPETLNRDSVFVVAPEFQRFGFAIENRFPGAELHVVETDKQIKLFVYRCTLENGCRKGIV